MTADFIIVRFGDITLKGKNRGRFEKTLIREIRRVTASFASVSVKRDFGRAYLELNGQEPQPVIDRLTSVQGLTTCSVAIQCGKEEDELKRAALDAFRYAYRKGDTFKVSVRRIDKSYPIDSTEMGKRIGGHLLRNSEGARVDVRKPDLDLRVEIRETTAYVYAGETTLMGGYPLGSNGKALLLLSGGIDSPVAGYLAMRHGLELEAVHFHSYPYTSERAKQKVIELAERLADYHGGRLTLHLVPFTSIQERIKQDVQEKLWITLMRRTMLRIVQLAAGDTSALGVVTGESLGQVASQTLSSMHTIGRGTVLPVLRPLIMTDKRDIVQLAERIGTFEISIQPYEDCCTLFMPMNPSTNPNVHITDITEAAISELPLLVEQAWRERETVMLGTGITGGTTNNFSEFL